MTAKGDHHRRKNVLHVVRISLTFQVTRTGFRLASEEEISQGTERRQHEEFRVRNLAIANIVNSRAVDDVDDEEDDDRGKNFRLLSVMT